MKRWLSTLVTVLCVAAATPLVAQQASDPVPQASAPAAQQASSGSASLPGPRLSPEWRRVEPSFADSSASRPVAAAAGSHTVTVTTLVLVLVVIIAVLVIAD